MRDDTANSCSRDTNTAQYWGHLQQLHLQSGAVWGALHTPSQDTTGADIEEFQIELSQIIIYKVGLEVLRCYLNTEIRVFELLGILLPTDCFKM